MYLEAVIVSSVALADFFSKLFMMRQQTSIDLLPFLALRTCVLNTGIGWSIGTLWHQYVLLILIITACVFFAEMLRRRRKALLPKFALSMLLGGAIGNLLDRVRFGGVIDFIDIYVGNVHFPIFNVADIAITIAVIMLMYDEMFGSVERYKTE